MHSSTSVMQFPLNSVPLYRREFCIVLLFSLFHRVIGNYKTEEPEKQPLIPTSHFKYNKKAINTAFLPHLSHLTCRRRDLNPQGIATTRTWTVRVCQFRHFCVFSKLARLEQWLFYTLSWYLSTVFLNFLININCTKNLYKFPQKSIDIWNA